MDLLTVIQSFWNGMFPVLVGMIVQSFPLYGLNFGLAKNGLVYTTDSVNTSRLAYTLVGISDCK